MILLFVHISKLFYRQEYFISKGIHVSKLMKTKLFTARYI